LFTRRKGTLAQWEGAAAGRRGGEKKAGMIPGIVQPEHWHAGASADSAIGSDGRRLRLIAITAGLCWSVLFVTIGLRYELQAYGDGSIFSYAVAVQDAWAFHWHNISGRLFVYFASMWPAETYVGLTGDARGGVMLYGFLFYVAPLIGLAATWAVDRSRGRVLFAYACASTACLCPLVFGCPTEMWMAHALLWPALALAHYARRGMAGGALLFAALLALTFTHGGGMVFAAGIVCSLALRDVRDPRFLRAAVALAPVVAIWLAVKLTYAPDPYFASMLPRAAWNFFDLGILLCPLSLLLIAALAGYAIAFLLISLAAPARAQLYAAALTAAALCGYWLWFDHWLHTDNRYYLRTELFLLAPMFVAAAVVHALLGEGRLEFLRVPLSRLRPRVAGMAAQALTGAIMVTFLVHAVETEKFVTAWSAYKSAIARLATGTASDPGLGDPRFVSTDRIPGKFDPLAWSSTTQYLSVLLAPAFSPNRLVVDPDEGYYWLSCETATANRLAPRAIPARSREMIGADACLHRRRMIAQAPARAAK
jgi:hypothetical protein